MFWEDKTEVLVVGAGPVGMVTALLLAKGGVSVRIIDQEWHAAAHSYACALHPRALALLQQLGVGAEVLRLGRRIDTVAFYEGERRRAELKLAGLGGEFPFMVVVPQDVFEGILERRLYQQARVKVHWNHRLAALDFEHGTAVASIERLGETAHGYGVPDWDWTVEKTLQTRAEFVIGADGHNSRVRQVLGLEFDQAGPVEAFEVHEFECERDLENEVRVVLDSATTNVMWPLADRRCRWGFQVPPASSGRDFPSKERQAIVFAQDAVNQETRQRVQQLLQARAPWFKAGVKEFDWSAQVQFERRVVKSYGRDRCWLAGDAAHQTSPVGMQSMNAGLREAEELAMAMVQIVRQGAAPDLLGAYQDRSREEWLRLLGLKRILRAGAQADAWMKERCARVLPCLPGCGDDLGRLASQVGLAFE